MPRLSGTTFMLNFVQEYLDGERNRIDWDLDFNHYLIKHYRSMERKNSFLANRFNYCLCENGFDKAKHLGDAAHKKFIAKQWKEFNYAMRDGML